MTDPAHYFLRDAAKPEPYTTAQAPHLELAASVTVTIEALREGGAALRDSAISSDAVATRYCSIGAMAG